MTRIAAFLTLTLVALVLALAPGFSQSTGSVAQAASLKTCTAKIAGKTKTWRCQTNQACCVNQFTGQATCGFAGLGCL